MDITGQEKSSMVIMQTNTVNKITLLIINPLTYFGSFFNHPQRQYDVVITNYILVSHFHLLTETII